VPDRQVPFKRIAKKQSEFIQSKYLPRGISLNDPRAMKREELIKLFEHIASREASHGPKKAFRFKAILSSRKKGELRNTRYFDDENPAPAPAVTQDPEPGPARTQDEDRGLGPAPAMAQNIGSVPATARDQLTSVDVTGPQLNPTLTFNPDYNFDPQHNLDPSLDPGFYNFANPDSLLTLPIRHP
jgi:hypothetical protein